jgi:CarD family transcriptional regulator
MAENGHELNKGEWIVHRYHGVGEVRGVEKKRLNGKAVSYYKVKTNDSTLWIPVDNSDTERIRPLATRSEFKKALKVLQRPAQEMNDNHNTRKSRIRNVRKEGELIRVFRLIRDLKVRQHEKKLNTTEQRSLHRIEEQLLQEWSVCMGIEVEEARQKLEAMIEDNINTE